MKYHDMIASLVILSVKLTKRENMKSILGGSYEQGFEVW